MNATTHDTTRPLPHRLLGVWAHPDDECYLSAGLMARIVESGGHVRLLCATRGEYGTSDPDLAGSAQLAAAREGELRASLAVLGVDDVHFLDLPDGGCDDADDLTMAALVAEHVEAIDADAVATFGPDGMTLHPDHLAVCRWSTMARSMTAQSTTSAASFEVLYAAVTDVFVERHRAMHDELGLFADQPNGQPVSYRTDELALFVPLDHTELARKREALRAHGSQTDALAELIGEETYFSWWRNECFRHPTVEECEAATLLIDAHRIGAGA